MAWRILDIEEIVEQVLRELETERTVTGKLTILKVADRLAIVYCASDDTLKRIAEIVRKLGAGYPFDSPQSQPNGIVSAKILRLPARLHLVETETIS